MNNQNNRVALPQVFSGLLVFSIAFIVTGWMVAGAIREVKASSQVISVAGTATRQIQSNYVIWDFSVVGKGNMQQEAYKNAQTYTAGVLDYLKAKKIPDNEVSEATLSSGAVHSQNQNGYETNQILYYTFTQNFEIRSSDVSGIAKLSSQISELVNQSIPVTSNAPQFLYTRLDALRIDMLADATKDAKARAEIIARAAHNRIGVIRSVDSGLFQVTPPNSTSVSGEGQYDTSTIDKDVTVIESVTFQIR